MNTLSSLVRSTLGKALGLTSLVAVALLALSYGAESAHAGNPILMSRGMLSALNPQPLPPRWNYLNPQPLPPRWNPGGPVYLNPQPLPPRWNFAVPSYLNKQMMLKGR